MLSYQIVFIASFMTYETFLWLKPSWINELKGGKNGMCSAKSDDKAAAELKNLSFP
ncbi:hypothetical protein VVDAL79087_02092 [Vibrio vulnificus]|nr:hypothetical protein VVDAL79087_02092 [Vibrio vulnificus]